MAYRLELYLSFKCVFADGPNRRYGDRETRSLGSRTPRVSPIQLQVGRTKEPVLLRTRKRLPSSKQGNIDNKARKFF